MPRIRKDLIEPKLSYTIVGLLYKIHSELGHTYRERQYADLFELKLKETGIPYTREVPVKVAGRTSNFVDFCVDDKILIELKAKPFVTREDYFQLQRYLNTLNKELGLLVNFRQRVLKPRRVLNSRFRNSDR